MRRPTFLLLIVACLFTDSSVLSQESRTTTWTGALDAGGRKLRLEIKITETGGKLTGELRSLDQNDARLKIENIKIKGESLSFSIPPLAARFSGKYGKNGKEAKGTFQQGEAELPLTLSRGPGKPAKPSVKSDEKLKEAWVGKLKIMLMEPVMQFRIVTTKSGETIAYFDSLTEGRTGFKATWSIKGDTLQFDVPQIKLNYQGKLNKKRDEAIGVWSQGGRELPLTLKKQTTVYNDRNVWENRPQRPKAPFPYESRKVTFENKADGVTLAGTLTIPKKPGRHPVVVLISGSGPQDRDETLMGHKPFLVLADYLGRRGIAVLRYDDRGTAESTGDFGKATTEDFARDASAAVEFLKQHPRINAGEIGLAGHSEGGLVAPMVVGMRDDIAFVVLMAATGVDGMTISLTQSEAMLRVAGIDEEEIKIAQAISRKVLAIAMKAKPGDPLKEQLLAGAEEVLQTIPEEQRETARKNVAAEIRNIQRRLQGNWMRFFLAYDPRPALEKIECPVLAIIGSKDVQVLPDLNMPEIRKALVKGGNKDFEMVELKGLNHLFQKCETGAMAEYVLIQETINPVALKKIGDWVVDHTTPLE